MRKLNNKGFTLIELLAVVVILAVVMGIAMTSVLSAMNKSRGGSLEDTTSVIVNGFNQKYTESLVGGSPNALYAGVVDSTDATKGYDFTVDASYYLNVNMADEFGISENAYKLNAGTGVVTAAAGTVTDSFVAYDADTGKFLVCMIANPNGNVYVAGFAVGGADASGSNTVTFNGSTYTFGTGAMFSCNEGTKSWK